MKPIILSLLVAVSLASCSNYGKKVKVDGTKGEVFYKGDGVTESDATKTGEFLKKEGWISSAKKSSIQISKEGESYIIRFVYTKSVYDTLKGIDDIFKNLGVRASKDVFGGKKVNISLANDHFKDYKTIPYDEATAKALEEPPPVKDDAVTNMDDYDHDTAGGIKFYWKGMSDDESKTIADYIVKNGSFSGGGGNVSIVMTKENGRYVLKFPITKSASNNAAYMTELEKVTKEIKDNLFANDPYTFVATDEQLHTVKTWDY